MSEPQSVAKAIEAIFAQGSEAEARQYIQDHFKKFPEELQQEIVTAMAAEALQNEAESLEAGVEFNKDVLKALAVWQMQRGSDAGSVN